MEQFDLFEGIQEQPSVSVFNDQQIIVLENLSEKYQKLLNFSCR